MRRLSETRFAVVAGVVLYVLATANCSSPAPLEATNNKPVTDTITTDPNLTYIPATGTASSVPARRTAAGYPIQYFISVPAGWPGKRAWPVVMDLPGSSKDWEPSAIQFGKVRDSNNYPFIVVTPVILTNGGDGPVSRTSPNYQYPSSVWDLIDQQGRCAFDLAGIQAIIADVRNLYAGQSKAFITGFSAGGNQAWAEVLLKPELLRAAALVGSNYSGRCVTTEVSTPMTISAAPERVLLPVRSFLGGSDPFFPIGSTQQAVAIALARANGYTNLATETVPGVSHEALPTNVFAYFYSLLNANERP